MHQSDLSGLQAKLNQTANRAYWLCFSLGVAFASLGYIGWYEWVR